MPTLHSHTHWQAPQADTQTKAYQRVCLSHTEEKKLKISPSKNFKNSNPQTDPTTLGQVVEKLNIDKGFVVQTTRTPGHNSILALLSLFYCVLALFYAFKSYLRKESKKE